VKILIFGAGVIGTFYGAKLAVAGHNVTVVARGERFTAISRYGLTLEDIVDHRRWSAQVDVVRRISPADEFDLALIAVRRDQLATGLPELVSSIGISTLLFMLNNATGSAHLGELFGRDRIMLGFPGVGGTREANVVRYAVVAQQPTTLGELDGRRSARLLKIAKMFRKAGLATRSCSNMDAWLKAHAFFVTAICGAIYLSGGDCKRLSTDDVTLKLMTKGVREGFAAVHALACPVLPFSLRVLFNWLPDLFAVSYWRQFLASEIADYVFGRHARAAAQEMQQVADDCRSLLMKSGMQAPALAQLYRAIDARVAGTT
jgi:2-dehydropantoate 2-reductase